MTATAAEADERRPARAARPTRGNDQRPSRSDDRDAAISRTPTSTKTDHREPFRISSTIWSADTLDERCRVFRPELALCATIVLMLLLRVFHADEPHRLVLRRRSPARRVGPVSGRPLARPIEPTVGSQEILHRHAGLRLVHGLLPHAAAVLRRAVRRSSRGSRAFPTATTAPDFYTLRAGRDAGHVPHGLGQSPADGLPGRRNGQRAVVRPGRHAQGPPAEQRGGAEVRRLRRRRRRRHALRHQPAGRRARLGPPADDGRPPGRAARSRRTRQRSATRTWCWPWAG